MFISPRNHGWKHWDLARKRGKPLEAALVIGGPPALTYLSGSRIPYGVEEYQVAGALIGEPLDLVRCKTVDLLVPCHAELVIEGLISTEYIEPEAPFGEYTGYMGGRVYNALYAVAGRTALVGKIVIAVDDDIDIHDPDAVIWALSYRMQPQQDTVMLPQRSVGLDPSGNPPFTGEIDVSTVQRYFGSTMLINAMRSWDFPPVSLPAREYMERAREIWAELGLPTLTPRRPWHGYELGDWSDRDREEARWAVEGDYYKTGERAKLERKPATE